MALSKQNSKIAYRKYFCWFEWKRYIRWINSYFYYNFHLHISKSLSITITALISLSYFLSPMQLATDRFDLCDRADVCGWIVVVLILIRHDLLLPSIQRSLTQTIAFNLHSVQIKWIREMGRAKNQYDGLLSFRAISCKVLFFLRNLWKFTEATLSLELQIKLISQLRGIFQ